MTPRSASASLSSGFRQRADLRPPVAPHTLGRKLTPNLMRIVRRVLKDTVKRPLAFVRARRVYSLDYGSTCAPQLCNRFAPETRHDVGGDPICSHAACPRVVLPGADLLQRVHRSPTCATGYSERDCCLRASSVRPRAPLGVKVATARSSVDRRCFTSAHTTPPRALELGIVDDPVFDVHATAAVFPCFRAVIQITP